MPLPLYIEFYPLPFQLDKLSLITNMFLLILMQTLKINLVT